MARALKATATGWSPLVLWVFILATAILHEILTPFSGDACYIAIKEGAASAREGSVSCRLSKREHWGIGQVLTMPLFFSSNAIYPIAIMPAWLVVLSHLNPLTYEVDALRAAMLARGTSAYGLGIDAGILLVMTTILVVVGSRLYPRVIV